MDATQVTSTKVPLHLRSFLTWNISSWNLDDWKSFLHSQNSSRLFTFRKGISVCREEPLWERNCDEVKMSMADFFEKYSSNDNQPIDWLYFDYKHIKEWFNLEADKLDISWKDFGFPEKNARDSTLWIGSKGAHTPCHLDTYGCNIVAQLFGQKRWYLFPPSETDNLKPTRVPYEESSIYSDINFACGCNDTSGINEIRTVVLNPGDVLIVPFHWWHYVENLSTAISINIWLPSIYDGICRLEESLVKYFISSVCRSVTNTDDILNPNEDDIPSIEEQFNLKEISWCLNQEKTISNESENKNNSNNEVPILSSEEFSKLLKSKCNGSKILPKEKNIRKELINAFCHPDTITLIRKKLESSNITC